MKTSITKQFRFEAAHTLPNHDGKCKNLHGHSYLLEVTIAGDIQTNGPKEGMIMDFADLSKIVTQEIIDQWDHQFLNDILPFPTTAENLASECFTRITKHNIDVVSVRIWETTTSYAEVRKDVQ